MGAKKKGKKGKGKKKKNVPEEIDDYTPMLHTELEEQRRRTKEKLAEAKSNRNMLQMEKDMVQDFYHNTRDEIREIEARIKNLDTDMQVEEEKHRCSIKVFMQKVKHLEYEHGNNCDGAKVKSDLNVKDERGSYIDNQKNSRGDKGKLKDEMEQTEASNRAEIEQMERDLKDSFDTTEKGLEEIRQALITKYDHKMGMLRDELELRTKVEIHEIEERKNKHINELMKNHQDAFKEMKNYFNDITRQNLELITMHKERLMDIRKQIEDNVHQVDDLRQEMEKLKKPLHEASERRDKLTKYLTNFGKNKMALRNAIARLQVLKSKEKTVKADKAELEEKFLKVEKEKKDMQAKFEMVIDQLRSKANVKNQYLDEVLAVRQAELEKKEVQLRELVQRSGLDQGTVDEICKKMEEAIEAKNSIIRNLRYSMAHATKAYNDAIRVYEAKLVEFGIPAEELGLELLET